MHAGFVCVHLYAHAHFDVQRCDVSKCLDISQSPLYGVCALLYVPGCAYMYMYVRMMDWFGLFLLVSVVYSGIVLHSFASCVIIYCHVD